MRPISLAAIPTVLLACMFAAPLATAAPPKEGDFGSQFGFGADATAGETEYFDSRDRVDISVAPGRTRVAPGDQLRIAVVFDHTPGWHVHTNNPDIPESLGDPEMYYGTIIEIDTPADSPLTPHTRFTQWPEPHAIDVGWMGEPVPYQVYEGKAIAIVPVTIAPDAPLGSHTITVKPGFQACDDTLCMAPTPYPPRAPGEQPTEDWLNYGHEVVIEIVALADADSRETIDRELFGHFDESVWSQIASGVDYVEFDLFGVISFDLDAGSSLGFGLLLLVAAVGGFLLNLTPCVLPVIPLKIMGLSKSAHGSRAKTLLLGLAMTAGVVGFWLALGIGIAFISGFTATNQLFQYPAFTIGVGVVIAIMSIGMCGLFAIQLPSFVYRINPSQDSMAGSFGFGIMTAVLSTPCTAPFMGAAAAWSATQPPSITLATFAAIGLGMAFPYIVLAAFPQLAEKMPRTGPASELIKQVMGLLMLAAAAYFIGVGFSGIFKDPAGPASRMYWWAVAAFGVAAGLWLAWRTIRITPRAFARCMFGGLGLAIFAISAFIGVRMTDKGPIDWVYYTPERFESALASGDVVVMEFTAEWCLNCKALEESVLRTPRIVELLHREDVTPIKVDLTGNAELGNAMLKKVDRLTIPLLVVFAPDGNATFKGDFYTPEQVVDAVSAAQGTAVASR